MNSRFLKIIKLCFGFCLTFLLLLGCSASKGLENYKVDTSGTIQAYPVNMNKDIIRLKGELMSKGRQVKDRWEYVFKVKEIVKYGPTFATVTPEVGEEVVLYTPAEVKFKKNSEVVLDVLTPINRGEGKLIINMVIE